ncbi:GNAT family N-acetyltransferase [Salinibacterium sp.]|uniref:GNAT family N-acetyltransferase n=1 Tax=Salinibacterium sp. TaxID=1915057 RepID=UPI00286A5393|nr:GNAT family N-acetyltransferase [Salinibacterium sp.]
MTVKTQMLDSYDSQLRLVVPLIAPLGQEFHSDGFVLRVAGQHRGFVETAQTLNVEGDELDQLIKKHRDFFAASGESVEWKTRAHDVPADIPLRLLAAGFVPEDVETVMVGDAEGLAVDPRLPEDVVIRIVHASKDLDSIAEMESEVWGEDFSWLANDLHSRITAEPENIVVLVAETEGRVVSAAWLVFKSGTDFAGLWGGSTLAEWRGQGIYKALVARRAQIARDRGVKYLQVDASKDSEPILLRLGFMAITTTTPYVWTPHRS